MFKTSNLRIVDVVASSISCFSNFHSVYHDFPMQIRETKMHVVGVVDSIKSLSYGLRGRMESSNRTRRIHTTSSNPIQY
jgi:hypothetical protein